MILSSRVRTRTTPLRKYFNMAAFKFPQAEIVQFSCQARLCKPDAADCSLQCSRPERARESDRRRKRELYDDVDGAANPSNDTNRSQEGAPPDATRVFNIIRVRAPGDDVPAKDDDGPTQRPDVKTFCLARTLVTVLASVIVGVLVIAIVACACLYTKLSSMRTEREKLEEQREGVRREMASYVNHGFRIPRPALAEEQRGGADGSSIRDGSVAIYAEIN
ncbi:PREDICTED: uncharacterized protein LOC106809521 [Priapulus caudatus]|uniref:Uncharacterized protein LOC106809521 n=1 Tax=Priapulus caudatus TaxID=37621 RepID=A0ABM1E7C9_PRICU|nr:PREDICTED: uncharacterized protein LOC106809521 [Priapulus caudatus]